MKTKKVEKKLPPCRTNYVELRLAKRLARARTTSGQKGPAGTLGKITIRKKSAAGAT